MSVFLCSTQMKKVMLTVFKHNHGAYQFFREALQWVHGCCHNAQEGGIGLAKMFSLSPSSSTKYRFEIDETSPSMSGCCGDDCSYEILSRRTKHGEASAGHTHGGGHCGGCCHWLALATVVVSNKKKTKEKKKGKKRKEKKSQQLLRPCVRAWVAPSSEHLEQRWVDRWSQWLQNKAALWIKWCFPPPHPRFPLFSGVRVCPCCFCTSRLLFPLRLLSTATLRIRSPIADLV